MPDPAALRHKTGDIVSLLLVPFESILQRFSHGKSILPVKPAKTAESQIEEPTHILGRGEAVEQMGILAAFKQVRERNDDPAPEEAA